MHCGDILAESQRLLLTLRQLHAHTNKLSQPKMLPKELSAVHFVMPPFTAKGLELVPVPLPPQHGHSAARVDTQKQ